LIPLTHIHMIAHFPWLGTGTPIKSGDKWLSSMQLSFIMVVKVISCMQ
jgi:hypothetical protein